MVYAGIEPFGSLHDELIGGQVCATVANYAGKMRSYKVAQAQPDDFMFALRKHIGTVDKKPEPDGILLDDPEEQSRLIKAALFGIKS